ncbi:MAG: hypothetical protein BAJALOKI1v1_270003 [Promethearchaeota archaeon]|nr:MAG: hypothetical protein BAJALOKI1v1_270003 [Candidatus Lokiarchaeota archaeon]
MKIDEIGVVLDGIPLISLKYYNSQNDEVDDISKSALITSLLQYAENIIAPVESFESTIYSMIFTKGKMKTAHNPTKSDIFSYIVIEKTDKKKELPEKERKKIIDKISKILDEFIKRYDGFDISEVSQFEEFKNIINKTIAPFTKSVDDKFASLFSE